MTTPAPSCPHPWLRPRGEGVVLAVHVQPRASRTEMAGLFGKALKIRVAGAPVEGKANAELTRFLARTLGVPQGAVAILRGETSRRKDVFVRGVAPAEMFRRLGFDDCPAVFQLSATRTVVSERSLGKKPEPSD